MACNTRVLFTALLRQSKADCICDIGSRDGEDALRFRNLMPDARIFAFEANHYNFDNIRADPRIAAERIELFPIAISNTDGEATFHITDVDYTNPSENRGTSSLMKCTGLELKESVTIPTRRLDTFLLEHFPECRNVGLWIDVEGAEYSVLEALGPIRDRIAAVHVETANRLMREGQTTYPQLAAMMEGMGFFECGKNFNASSLWGDAVFVNQTLRAKLGWKLRFCQWKASAASTLKLGHVSAFLQKRFPSVYRFAYRFVHRAGV